jgi:hypothetical protein
MPENAIQRARIARTLAFFSDRAGFMAQLAKEIKAHVRRAGRLGLRAAVRLNGTSDLPWEKIAPDLFAQFPEVTFYDYTKSVKRALASAAGKLPSNYSLTFSRSESNGAECFDVLAAGGNVAAVYAHAGLIPSDAINGDAHDLRFLDRKGAIIALSAKGRAKRDASGFVVR